MKTIYILTISCLVGLAASAPQFVNSHHLAGIEQSVYDKYLSNPEFLKFLEEIYQQYQSRFAKLTIPNVNHASISPSALGQADYSKNPFLNAASIGRGFSSVVVPAYGHHVAAAPKVKIAPKILVAQPVIPDVPVLVEDPEVAKEQARRAKYAFSTDIQDGLQDGSHQRQEVRDGLALKGTYSYSDGFYKRTVQYEADENGYRVINEEVVPIGQGPKVNINGEASVATQVAGSSVKYQITKDDINYKSIETEKGPSAF